MKKLLLFIVVVAVAGCMRSPISEVADTITEESLMQHIEFLSSDDFMGRGTGTEGEEKTVDYLISQLKENGIEGGMPDGSYVQEVPLIGQKTDEDARLTINKGDEAILSLDYYTDFMAWPANMEEEVSIEEAGLCRLWHSGPGRGLG